MDLNSYISPLRKWWRLLVAATLIAGVTSLIATLWQPNIYAARTTLIVGRSISDPNPDASELSLDSQLAATYAQIANREIIQNATKDALGLDWLPKYSVQAEQDSQLLEVSVTDTIPARAQAVANELANQLILKSPGYISPEEKDRQEFINTQLANFETQISANQQKLEQLQKQLGELNSAGQIAETQAEIDALQLKQNSLQETYATLLQSSNQGAANVIRVLVPAEVPVRPIAPNRPLIFVLACLGGFALAAGAAYLMENAANTVNTADEVKALLHVPVLANIPEVKSEKRGVYVAQYPFSIAAEAFRSLRTSLEFESAASPFKSVLITSPGISEGKSTVATNLAFIMAQAGKKVALVGADLREPVMQELLDLPESKGLADLFIDSVKLDDVLITYKPDGNETILVLPSGTPPPNPAELLISNRMDKLLDELKERVDIVIVDSSPFIVADASILAAKVDAVLVVVRPEFTRKDAIVSMQEQVSRIGARIIGVVMNQVALNARAYSGYYGKYKYVQKEEPREEQGPEATTRKVGEWLTNVIEKLTPGRTK
ncbi:MAG: polysaccharide biosynthesis tyrosine autokinase [Chloroflexi bacterium]|nr:polysaccharide biosynthesis tyrosine autokinase [Chloroflexota bacterium]